MFKKNDSRTMKGSDPSVDLIGFWNPSANRDWVASAKINKRALNMAEQASSFSGSSNAGDYIPRDVNMRTVASAHSSSYMRGPFSKQRFHSGK